MTDKRQEMIQTLQIIRSLEEAMKVEPGELAGGPMVTLEEHLAYAVRLAHMVEGWVRKEA